MEEVVVSKDQARLIEVTEKIMSPLVKEGIFEDVERALQSVLLDYIDRRVALYKDKNTAFEIRHNTNFDTFTISLKDNATPEQEDEWMDWETALMFLKKWQVIREQVTRNALA